MTNNSAQGPGGGIAFVAGQGTTNIFNCQITGNSTLKWQECLEKCFEAFCEARPAECD